MSAGQPMAAVDSIKTRHALPYRGQSLPEWRRGITKCHQRLSL